MIGGGAAGLVTALLLREHHDVTLYEREGRLGGHAQTVEVPDGHGGHDPVDVGFMVLNDRTYPRLHEVFARLGGIPLHDADMSFGFACRRTGVAYSLAHRDAVATSPVLRELLPGILQFTRSARRALAEGSLGDRSLSEHLAAAGVPAAVVELYVVPMGAAIWSTAPGRLLDAAAEPYLRFLANHGLLDLAGARPSWRAVTGGSRIYVERIRQVLGTGARLAHDVTRVRRRDARVEVEWAGGSARHDAAVLAVHADQALAMLVEPTVTERSVLGAFRYQRNEAVLHLDETVLPADRRSWAAWNYEREGDAWPDAPTVTYHLNRVQGLALRRDVFLTLNRRAEPRADRILGRFTFDHPTFARETVAAQAALRDLNRVGPIHFCGSYHGWGFHEDAVRSAFDVVASMEAAR